MVKWLDSKTKQAIADAVQEAERHTSGEISVHVTGKNRRPVLEEAKTIFLKQKMNRTAERNGVLIYLAWENHEFAVVGDEGIHAKVGYVFWNETRDAMRVLFSKNEYREGVLTGVRSVGEKLKSLFPRKPDDRNELSNKVTEPA